MIADKQLRLPPFLAFDQEKLMAYVAREMSIDLRTISAVRILKRSIDARHNPVYVNLTIRIFVGEDAPNEFFTPIPYHEVSDKPSVLVVGEGPAGLFASLRLIELGIRPIIIERGKNVRSRKLDIAAISHTHRVNPESNYCFGEGGAGAYSDGKLYTRSKKRGCVDKILNVLCQHGAPSQILSDAHPHIGTDKLPLVIENIRSTIIRCGGEVHHQEKMVGLTIKGNNCLGIETENLANGRQLSYTGPVILATGHSARDVYRHLAQRGVELQPKGIAVGVRLEHPSELIDRIQYHSCDGRGKYLPAAEYSFVTQIQNRGVYSFCMCPGGFVIPSATDKEQIVVNGMSPSNRGGKWSNSGMVVEVRPDDVEGDDALKLMRYQENIERTCWQQAHGTQKAPAQRMSDFVNGKMSFDLPKSSYSPGLTLSPLHLWMPAPIVTRLQQGFKVFGAKSKGFLTNDASCIAVETRTSSPVRILRDNTSLSHIRIKGLYPCGEGAGYAGGIVSAAIDGERCAESLASNTYNI